MDSNHILIIDDNKSFVDSTSNILEKNGFIVSKSYSGSKGLKLATEEKTDIILLDFLMADINGFDVLDELKKRKIHTKVIVISIVPDRDNAILFIKKGANDYLWKDQPNFEETLILKIKRVIELDRVLTDLYSETALDEILDENTSLKNRVNNLEIEKELLTDKRYWSNIIIKIIYLILVFGSTLIIYQYNILNNSYIIFIFPLLLFILLSIPLHKVIKFSSKIYSSETSITMEDTKLEVYNNILNLIHTLSGPIHNIENILRLIQINIEKRNYEKFDIYTSMALISIKQIYEMLDEIRLNYREKIRNKE